MKGELSLPFKIKRSLIKQFKDNFMIYFLIIAIFFTGIIIGSISIKVLDIEQKSNIITFLNSFFKNIDSVDLNSSAIIKQSIFDNFKSIGLIWLTGLIVIGIVVIPFIILFRGFSLGFTVGFLVSEYGIKGFLFSILGILPHNLFAIPGILLIGATGIIFSINSIKKRKSKLRNKNLFFNIIDYSVLILFFSIIVFIACIIESYISPIFLRLLYN